jgi:Na+-transporting methylmalonyl-CoA/oxaloacetate decarboxylase beta subunit
LGFAGPEAGAIGIIGGADGPTAIFLSSKLANGVNVLADGTTVKNLIGPIAIAAYSYMALVPVIQPPIMKLLTSEKERKIRMKPPRAVTKLEKIMFPDHRATADDLYFAKCASAVRDALLRKYPEGIRRD